MKPRYRTTFVIDTEQKPDGWDLQNYYWAVENDEAKVVSAQTDRLVRGLLSAVRVRTLVNRSPKRKTLVTQGRWDEIFEQRCNELEDMPGGRQGANPDMSEFIVEGDEDE